MGNLRGDRYESIPSLSEIVKASYGSEHALKAIAGVVGLSREQLLLNAGLPSKVFRAPQSAFGTPKPEVFASAQEIDLQLLLLECGNLKAGEEVVKVF